MGEALYGRADRKALKLPVINKKDPFDPTGLLKIRTSLARKR
jgi:hypothetical protein